MADAAGSSVRFTLPGRGFTRMKLPEKRVIAAELDPTSHEACWLVIDGSGWQWKQRSCEAPLAGRVPAHPSETYCNPHVLRENV